VSEVGLLIVVESGVVECAVHSKPQNELDVECVDRTFMMQPLGR
jgi:hypothetical protein